MQRPDNVGRADGLTPAHLDDGAGIGEHPLEEVAKVQARFAVDTRRDALDAAAAGETADVRLGDALNVVTEDFSGSEVLVMLVRMLCEKRFYRSPVAFSAAYFSCAEAGVAQALASDASTSEAANGSFAARSLASGRTRWSHFEMPDV